MVEQDGFVNATVVDPRAVLAVGILDAVEAVLEEDAAVAAGYFALHEPNVRVFCPADGHGIVRREADFLRPVVTHDGNQLRLHRASIC